VEMYGSDLIQNYDVYSPPSALTPPISLHTGAAEEKPDLRVFLGTSSCEATRF